LIAQVLPKFGDRLRHSISATTREPRSGERDGVNYHFWTQERFERGLQPENSSDTLPFSGIITTEHRATGVEPFRFRGIGVILDVDVQGMEQLRRTCPDGLTVFSIRRLENSKAASTPWNRIRGAIQRRLETLDEIERAGEFDVRLLNGDVDKAAEKLCGLSAANLKRQTNRR
jgi:guanylate kinase